MRPSHAGQFGIKWHCAGFDLRLQWRQQLQRPAGCNGVDSNLEHNLRANNFKYFDTNCFTSPATGYFGNTSTNPINGPGNQDWNIGAQKLFPLPVGKETDLQLRIEAFNVFNHPAWGLPGTVASTASTHGIITSAADPRVFQAVAKVTF